MSTAEARTCADQIRTHLNDARNLILELHDRDGWKALSYSSWFDCVQAEFGKSKSTLYRQLEAAKVEREITTELSLEKSPTCGTFDKPPKIAGRTLNALAALPEGTRTPAYKEAIERSGGKPTAKVVQQVVDEKIGKTRINNVPVADPPEIAAARLAGKIAPDSVVEIVDLGESDTVEEIAEEIEEASSKIDDLDDNEWLNTLPLREKLAGVAMRIFDRDALLYRQTEPARKTFLHACRSPLKQHRRGLSTEGAYAYALSRYLKHDHPKNWVICPPTNQGGCGGTGQVTLIGTCNQCYGRGYRVNL